MKQEKKQPALDVRALLVARFGEEKVAKWEKEFAPRKLNVIVVEDKFCVLRPITALEVSEFSIMTATPDVGLEKASRYLIGELWIDGDMEIQDDEEYFISAMLQIQRVSEVKKSSFYRL